jgi:hypothetical protein
MLAKFVFQDGHVEEQNVPMTNGLATLSRQCIPAHVAYIDILSDDFSATAGDDGYFVIPNLKDENLENNGHAALTLFRERPDSETVFPDNIMPIYAVRRGDRAILAVVCGMLLDYSLVCGVKDGHYYLHPRFVFDGEIPYEDIEIRFFELSGKEASYPGIARRYRQYQLERGACQPLKERSQAHPVVGESALGPEVRLRMGWKPVPPPVLEQTEANEPPMHAAITLKRTAEIVEEFHRQGIENAEFCLVGWNKSGHDGRWPDIFPVDPLLGDEDELKRLIQTAKAYNYLICAHTNVMDSYSIAKRFSEENLIRLKDGSREDGGRWGGGQSHRLCPKAAHEKNATDDFADMKRLGFRGTHYLDVMSILRPIACHNPKHPLTPREAGEWRGKTLALAREQVGASGSEGSWDFCIGSLDYVLYSVFHPDADLPALCDRVIPLWHLVYHGIVLYNTSCGSVNSAVNPDRKAWLKNVEFGGRPLVYFYAKFLSVGSNWMGEVDCGCATDAELRECVTEIKREFDEYKLVRELQFEFMEDHDELAHDVFKTTYSNGTAVIVNYNDTPYAWEGRTIPPCDFAVASATGDLLTPNHERPGFADCIVGQVSLDKAERAPKPADACVACMD